MLYPKLTDAIFVSQSVWLALISEARESLKVLIWFSATPLLRGLAGVVQIRLIFSISATPRIVSLVNSVPLSLTRVVILPCLRYTACTSACATVLDSLLGRAITSAYRVSAHFTTSTYWFPASLFGKGPVRSMCALSQGWLGPIYSCIGTAAPIAGFLRKQNKHWFT